MDIRIQQQPVGDVAVPGIDQHREQVGVPRNPVPNLQPFSLILATSLSAAACRSESGTRPISSAST